ncbi:MAG: helix-turn-helix domain-containing protein [Phycisphaerales bacterium]|nr:helix-turn-helix domain-containing protein [Phycisphaerales bacterium]
MTAMTTEPVLPSVRETQLAKESSRKLAPLATKTSPTVQVHIATIGRHAETVDLPTSAFQLLIRILTEMSQGNAVTLMPIHSQLTTQQAAELLGVSRPFVVKELKEGRIRYQMVGTHRRIAYSDLMAYKEMCRSNHEQTMDELVQQAQNLKMGY